jgi:general secretion pathway protein J
MPKVLNNSGFTLIELMIALLLMVIVSGALYGTYFSVVGAREKAGDRIEARREISSTLGKLHNEIASAYLKKNGIKNLQFVVEDRDSFGKQTSILQFTALTPPRVELTSGSDLVLVRYSVNEKEGALTLMREARDPYLNTTVRSVPYPVIEGVESFQVECYDGAKWVKTWDTALTPDRLPNNVRVTVTLKGGGSFSTIASPGSRKL